MRRSVLAMQRSASRDASKLLPLKFFDTAMRMDRLLADARTDDPDGWRPSALTAERAGWTSKKQRSVEATSESISTDMYQCDGAGRSCYPICKTQCLIQERRRGPRDWNRRWVLHQKSACLDTKQEERRTGDEGIEQLGNICPRGGGGEGVVGSQEISHGCRLKRERLKLYK
jgi:hypothetical protein